MILRHTSAHHMLQIIWDTATVCSITQRNRLLQVNSTFPSLLLQHTTRCASANAWSKAYHAKRWMTVNCERHLLTLSLWLTNEFCYALHISHHHPQIDQCLAHKSINWHELTMVTKTASWHIFLFYWRLSWFMVCLASVLCHLSCLMVVASRSKRLGCQLENWLYRY